MRNGKIGYLGALLSRVGFYGEQFFLFFTFQWKLYLRIYPDLELNGVHTKQQAIRHWLVYGKKEGRLSPDKASGFVGIDIISQSTYEISGDGLILLIRPRFAVWEIAVTQRSPSLDKMHIYLRKIKKSSPNKKSRIEAPVRSFSVDALLLRTMDQLRSRLDKDYRDMNVRGKIATKLLPDSKLYSLAAIAAFEAAETGLPAKKHSMDYVIRWLIAACELDPTSGQTVQSMGVFLSRFSKDIIHKTADLGLLEAPAEAQFLRRKMLDSLSHLVQLKNELFQKTLGLKEGSTPSRPRFGRILMVGTAHIPQVHYYRVKQKMEHFEMLGLETDYLEQAELGGLQWQTQLANVDLVIACRLPATFETLRFIYYAKGLGIPVLYDIDDLIFNGDHFPGSLTSYADLIDRRTYIHLMLDVPLFEKALSCCDGIMVSTAPLVRQVRQYVDEKIPVWVYPNLMGEELLFLSTKKAGQLLALNSQDKPFLKDGRLRIFYGSGTKAHKEIFYEVLAPALAMILEECEEVEVQIIGHFKLPKILERFVDRILIIELIKDYGEYLEHLKRADINVAILERTVFTDCKSEIKWLEAAAFAIPSVLTPTELHASVLREGQEVLFASSIAEWVRALGRLIEDEALRERIGRTAFAKAFSDYGEGIGKTCAENILQHHLPALSSPKRKRILAVNVYFSPQSIGGATRIVESQVSYLMKQYGNEYEMHVLCADCSGSRHPYEAEQYAFGAVLVTKLYVPNKSWQEHSDPQVLAFCRDFYLKYDFDLIHFHCLQLLTASVVDAAQELRIPYIVTVHDGWWLSSFQFLIDESGEAVNTANLFVKSYELSPKNDKETDRRDHLKRCLRQARAVLAVSEAFAKVYRLAGLDNVMVNENGVENLRVLPRVPSPQGKVRVAYVGGINSYKGFFLFQKALEKGKFESLEAVVIDHALESGEEIREKWGKTQVKIIPKVRQAEINRIYSEIDVLVAPSLWPESYGLITREAKMAGVWVIASDRGAVGADVSEGIDGHVISVDDGEDLFMALDHINKNKDFFLNFRGAKTGKQVRSPADQTEELVRVYKNFFETGKTHL